jgi:peroxiredoxin
MPAAPGAFPSLRLPDPQGRSVALAGFWTEGPALVVLGHRDCKTTRETLPRVDRVFRRRGPGASVVAVLQDDAETARALVSQQGLALPVLLDPEPHPLALALALEAVPALFLVEPGGAIAAASAGFCRADVEAFAARLGVVGELFASDERVPAFRPG